MALTHNTASGGHADRQPLWHCSWVVNGLRENITFPRAQAVNLKDRASQTLKVQPKIVENRSHGEESDFCQ